MSWPRRLAFLLTLLGLAAPALAAKPVELTLKVSPTSGALDEDYVATLQIVIRGVSGPERETPPDFADFTVVSQTGLQTPQWVNKPDGTQEIRITILHRYRLRPRRAGRLTIGPAKIRLDGEDYESKAVTVEVLEGAAPGPILDGGVPNVAASAIPGFTPPDPATAEPTFIHVVADRSRVLVGEQVTVTWLLYSRADVLKFEPRPVRVEGGSVVKILEPQSYFTYHEEVVGGREYIVATVARSAIFPSRPGKLVIPPYEADVATMYTSIAAPLHVASRPVNVDVQPLPPGAPAGFNPAFVGPMTVEASVDRNSVPASESLVLTLTLRGTGALQRASKAPPLTLDGFEVLPSSDCDERFDTSTDVVRAEHRCQYVLTPKRGGRLVVGPIAIPYFDPVAGRYLLAEAAPLTVEVIGDPAAAGPGAGAPTRDNVVTRDIRPLREPPALAARVVARFQSSRLFFGALAAPGLIYLVVVLADRLRERLRRDTPRARLRRARGRARKRLHVAEVHIRAGRAGRCYAEIARVLREHIEERVGEPVAAMTHDVLRAFLARRGFPEELVGELVAELESCDFARFAPSSSGPGEMRAAVRRVHGLLRAIERVHLVDDTEEARR
jgi:hypothetical protein